MNVQAGLQKYRAFVASSMDPVCVTDNDGVIRYMSLSMKSLFKLKGNPIKQNLLFDDLIDFHSPGFRKLAKHVSQLGKTRQWDQVPVSIGQDRFRVSVKAVPYKEAGSVEGLVIVIRDLTPDFLLQAKYQKISVILKEKAHQIQELEAQVQNLQNSLRRAARASVAR